MAPCEHQETYRFHLGATIEGQRCAHCGETVEQWHVQTDAHPLLAFAVFLACILAVVLVIVMAVAP